MAIFSIINSLHTLTVYWKLLTSIYSAHTFQHLWFGAEAKVGCNQNENWPYEFVPFPRHDAQAISAVKTCTKRIHKCDIRCNYHFCARVHMYAWLHMQELGLLLAISTVCHLIRWSQFYHCLPLHHQYTKHGFQALCRGNILYALCYHLEIVLLIVGEVVTIPSKARTLLICTNIHLPSTGSKGILFFSDIESKASGDSQKPVTRKRQEQNSLSEEPWLVPVAYLPSLML